MSNWRWSDLVVCLLAGLALGAIVHIAVVLRTPMASHRDAYSRLALAGADGVATLLSAADGEDLPGLGVDPAAARAACAYNLAEGPLMVSMPASGLTQTLAVHDRSGRIIYALTDRAAVRGAVSLAIMTPEQQEEARNLQDEPGDDAIIEVVTRNPRGLVVVRAIAPSPPWRGRAEEAVTSVTCVVDD